MRKGSLILKITLIIGIIATVGICAEAGLSSVRIANIMEESSKKSLADIVSSKAETITEYVDQQFRVLDAYSMESSMAALIESNGADSEAQVAAQAYTQKLMKSIPNLDSLLYMNYEGHCYAHNVPDLVGYQSDAENVALVQGLYFQNPPNPQYSMTAVASPATGNVTLLFSKSLYSSAGKPVGYVALGLTSAKLEELLGGVKLSSSQEIEVVTVRDGEATSIYDTDTQLVTTVLEKGPMADLAAKMKDATIDEAGSISYTSLYTGKQMLGSYKYLPAYGWVLFVASDTDTLYSQAGGAVMQLWIIAALVLIVLIAISILVIRFFLKPLRNVSEALTKVADYDLNVEGEIERFKTSNDEIGTLANATSDVVDMLKGAISVLRDSSTSLNGSSGNLDDTSRKLINVSTENTAITENFSASIEQTTNAIKMVEDEINKIVALVDQVDEKVTKGAEHSESLISNAATMNDRISSNISSNVETMDQTVAAMEEAIESLQAVEEINKLADAIMDITSQTNLLSLNASIEAARAGEAGRGFAVVANEIGQLADQSKNTAMNIQKIVESSNMAVENVKSQVNRLIDYMKGDVAATYESFADHSRQYGEGISVIRETVNEIGTAMEDLGRSINEIAKEIAAVSEASEENSNGVNDIIQKNEETTQITIDIEKLAESSRSDADNLGDIVNKFKF